MCVRFCRAFIYRLSKGINYIAPGLKSFGFRLACNFLRVLYIYLSLFLCLILFPPFPPAGVGVGRAAKNDGATNSASVTSPSLSHIPPPPPHSFICRQFSARRPIGIKEKSGTNRRPRKGRAQRDSIPCTAGEAGAGGGGGGGCSASSVVPGRLDTPLQISYREREKEK